MRTPIAELASRISSSVHRSINAQEKIIHDDAADFILCASSDSGSALKI